MVSWAAGTLGYTDRRSFGLRILEGEVLWASSISPLDDVLRDRKPPLDISHEVYNFGRILSVRNMNIVSCQLQNTNFASTDVSLKNVKCCERRKIGKTSLRAVVPCDAMTFSGFLYRTSAVTISGSISFVLIAMILGNEIDPFNICEHSSVLTR